MAVRQIDREAAGCLKLEEGKMNSIKRFVSNEEGLETVEYAVMTALVVGALIIAIGALSTAVSDRMDTTSGIINAIP